MIWFPSENIFRALHLWKSMQRADKSRCLPLCPVYRIMHSIPGSSAARLSNLMSSYSKWNVSGACRNESFCLLTTESDQTAAKYSLFMGANDCKSGDRVDATPSHQRGVWTWCSQLHNLWLVFRDWVSRGEWGHSARSHFSDGGVGRGKKRYKQLSESWYRLNPFTIYIFTYTSLLAAQ